MPEPLTYAKFNQYLHQTFTFHLGLDCEVDLDLVEAIAQSNEQNHPEGYEAFSIVFRGPKQPLLQQATYSVRHADIGEFPLFIVPVRQDREGHCYYEALFSSL